MVEGRHFVDLGHRHLHFGRERDQMWRRKAPEVVLNQMQILNEEVAAPGRITDERGHLLPRFGVNCPTFRDRANTWAFAFGRGHWTD